MAYSQTALQRGFVVAESTFNVTPTIANADAFRFITLETDSVEDRQIRPDKSNAFSPNGSIAGDKSATWRATCSLAGSGAAGTAPDIAPLLKAAAGSETTNAGVSVQWDPADLHPSVAILVQDDPSTVDQQLVIGGIVSQMIVRISETFPTAEFSGPCVWSLKKLLFSGTPTDCKGGLSAFPTSPTTPVYNGVPPPGRTGTISLGGVTFTNLKSATLTFNMNRSLGPSIWGSRVLSEPVQNGVRQSSVEFELYDDDVAATTTFKLLAEAATPTALSFGAGTTAGNIWTFLLSRCIIQRPSYGYGESRRTVKFSAFPESSAVGATDEFRWTQS